MRGTMEYPKDPKFARYYFRSHSFDELEEWTERMRFFRFVRAIGGHANDGDELSCALRYDSEEDLLSITAKLGMPLQLPPPDALEAEPGRSYTRDEFDRLRSPIERFPRYEQPGHVTIAGVPTFVWVRPDRLTFRVAGAKGDPYEVTEKDVENAIAIERDLAPFADRVIDPPVDGDHCFRR